MSVKLEFFVNKYNKKILGNTFFLKFFNKNKFIKFNDRKFDLKKNIEKKKIFSLISFIKKKKFTFKKPVNRKVIIFDSFSDEILKKNFFSFKCYVLQNRIDKIRELNFSPAVIFFFLKNFFKFSLKINYLIALIETIKPKLIVSSIDNSQDFSIISLYLKNKINCVLFKNIQILNYNKFIKEKLYFKKIFYFGKEIRKNSTKDKFNYIPPIQSLYFSQLKKKNKKGNKFQICLIDKNMPTTSHFKHEVSKNNFFREKDYFLLLQFLNKLSMKYNFKILIALKAYNKFEMNYRLQNFKKYLPDANYVIYSRSNNLYSSFNVILKSDMVIGCDSSMLNQAFLLNKKTIMFLNNADNKSTFFGNNFAKINSNDYKVFEKIFFKIKNTKFNDYLVFSNLEKYKIFFDKFNFLDLKKKINKIIINE